MINQQYAPSDVLISVREPFDKNTLWIHPHEDDIDVKIFKKGWKVLSSTKDLGLSNLSKTQVESLVNTTKEDLITLIKKYLGKFSSSNIQLMDKQKQLELKIAELETKLDKLTKRYTSIISKLNNG